MTSKELREKYQISYQKKGVFQCIQVNAQTEAAAVAYFKEYKPSAEYIGISTTCDSKPGMPCISVPDGWEAAQEKPSIYDRMGAELEAKKDRSAWGRGVNDYALELVEELEERAVYEGRNPEPGAECEEWMKNGAQDWAQYSWGGSSLIYDGDIAKRLCTPSELKKTRNGERRPNSREEWLDVQARALYQACNRVSRLYRSIVTA